MNEEENVMECVLLNNGKKMPLLGYGVYQIKKEDTYRCVKEALEVGYRLIDTAAGYQNEEEVGKAIRDSGISREEIFVVTKIWVADFGDEKTKHALDKALKKLNIDYIDLVLLHQAFGDYYGAYRALEDYYKQGKIKAIGVSNFYPDRLLDLYMNMEIKPMVNQIECHPFYQKEYDVEEMKKLNVVPMAWGPLAEGGHDIFDNEILKSIGAKYHKSNAQVSLRWNMDRGVVVIPKSTHKNRMIENFNIQDFHLDENDVSAIKTLDTGKTEIIDHYNLDVVRMLNTIKFAD